MILERIITSGYKRTLLEFLATAFFMSATPSFHNGLFLNNANNEALSRITSESRELHKHDSLETELVADPETEKLIQLAPRTPNPITLSYSFHEEQFLAQQFYQSASIEYRPLSYDEHPHKKATFESEPEYEVESSSVSEAESAVLTLEEARETMREIQYASLLGSITDVSFEERRQMGTWILFNKVQFGLAEMDAFTRNVNYGPLL